MAIIVIFKTSGKGQAKSTAATDYLYGAYCSLTNEQKEAYGEAYKLRERARESNDIDTLIKQDSVLGQIKGKRRDPLPEAINGNRKAVEYAIEQTPFVHKYVSGVIAHAFEDTEKLRDNPHIEEEWRELFEELCFAGLPKEERLIDWVRHTHQGNIENYFLIPRIHLRTGRSFNPAPPNHQKAFNLLRDYLNLKHDLESPTDSLRRRLTRDDSKYSKRYELKKKLNAWVEEMVTGGKFNCRDDIVRALENRENSELIELVNVKTSANFISLRFKNRETNIRLKGFVFSDAFDSPKSLTKDAQIPDKKQRLAQLWNELQDVISDRAEANAGRYGLPKAESKESIYCYLPPNSKWLKQPPFYSQPSQSEFQTMPDFNPNLRGIDMLMQLERQQAIAARIAQKALKHQLERHAKFVQQWLKEIIEDRNESYREAISIEFSDVNKRSDMYQRKIIEFSEKAEQVLSSCYRANSAAVSRGAEDDLRRDSPQSPTNEERVPKLSEELERTIGSFRTAISVNNAANTRLEQPIEQAGELTERLQHSYLKLTEAITDLGTNYELREKYKLRLIQNEKRSKVSVESRIERVVRLIEGGKPSTSKTFKNER